MSRRNGEASSPQWRVLREQEWETAFFELSSEHLAGAAHARFRAFALYIE
jgi:hypothetical protein